MIGLGALRGRWRSRVAAAFTPFVSFGSIIPAFHCCFFLISRLPSGETSSLLSGVSIIATIRHFKIYFFLAEQAF